MSMRPQGRGFHRGGYGYHRGGQWEDNRGGHRGGGGGGRAEYHHVHEGRSTRPPPPRHRHNDPENLLASLGHDAQLALTTALINTVLKTSEEKESRGSFRERGHEGPYRQREQHREERGGTYYREEMRPRRQYPAEAPHGRYESHWSEDGGRRGRGQQHHHFDRERFNPQPHQQRYGTRYQHLGHGNKRRLSPPPHAHQGPYKRQRMEMNDERPPHHYQEEEEEENYPEEGKGSGRRHGDKWGMKWDWYREDGERRMKSTIHEDREPRERSKRSESEGGDGKDGDGGGVQVTIRADGERAVNSDGFPGRVAGRLFVDLRCPHCPNQKSITFKEYKLHLTSESHKSQLNKLARKHTVVLRKIRFKQRQEQKEIEDKWNEENQELFKTAVSRFCNTCKLAFKFVGSGAHGMHNRSKLHRMQRHYLHPRCGLCHFTFPSRMVYEHHIASINHLRVRTATVDNQGGEGGGEQTQQADELTKDDDHDDELDLANFMTLDSVGDDDNEEGSEHEEITGGMEAVEAAEKEAANGNDSEEEMEGSGKRDCRPRRGKDDVDDEETPLVELDWEKEQPEEEEEEGEHKPLGKEYVHRVEAYYCSLCYKIIRADSSLGSRAVQRHCRSLTHLSNYWDHHPTHDQEEEEGGEDEKVVGGKVDDDDKESIEGGDSGILGLEGDQEQDKLWDEVDKGLSQLQGEILTEIGESAKENGTKEENQKKTKCDDTAREDITSDEEEEEEIPKAKAVSKAECDGQGASEHNSAHTTTEGLKDAWEEVGEDFPA